MAFYFIKKYWNPEIFQGAGKKRNYFEGWYFKLVDKNLENTYAIIPGVSITKDDPHAFIQILDGTTGKAENIKFNIDDFKFSKKVFNISIGNNLFSKNNLKIKLRNNDSQIYGNLRFKNLINWPKKILSPGIMGWYSFLPFMECYHAVVSMGHLIEGQLCIKNKEIDYSGGKGYIEKDWGSSFPEGWIWMQSNHFSKENTSFLLSIAKIPWLGNYFTGLISGLLLDGKLYKFTTYSKAKILNIEFDGENLHIAIEDKSHYLEIKTKTSESGELYSPKLGKMDGRINESIKAELYILLKRKNGITLFEGTGRAGGLEITNISKLF